MSQEISLPLSPVQLRDVFPVELSAKRAKQVQPGQEQPVVHLSGPTILQPEDPEQAGSAQVEMGARVHFASEPGPFDIEVKVVGDFIQVQDLPDGLILPDYLTQVSLTLLMPFLREYIFALGIQLHIGPLLLPIITPQAIPSASAGTRPSRRRRQTRPATQE